MFPIGIAIVGLIIALLSGFMLAMVMCVPNMYGSNDPQGDLKWISLGGLVAGIAMIIWAVAL